ncbi:MAG TPA: restriction endonuclease [Acidimicrobiia bacterium]|nr:restriction endonuclease [Acidimicrobiia bacterium]
MEGNHQPLVAPPRRNIENHRDAELFVAEWMHWLGWAGASATAPTSDGGVDVASSGAVAQVKYGSARVGRPALQALFGAAQALGKRALFFSAGGFSPQAITWGNQVGMALFGFDSTGEVRAVNSAATALLREAKGLPPPRNWTWLIFVILLVPVAYCGKVGFDIAGFWGSFFGALLGMAISGGIANSIQALAKGLKP